MTEPIKPVGDMFERIASEQGFDLHPSEEGQVAPDTTIAPKLDREYIPVFDGEKEILLPKDAKVKLSTKAGDNMELSVKDWADAPWSKREASRLVNEKVMLEREHQALRQQYQELDSLFAPEAASFKGAEWTAQALKALYNLNPQRGADIAAFVEAIKSNNGLSDEQLKQSELQKKNIELEKQNNMHSHQMHFDQLKNYSLELSHQMMDVLGVDAETLESKIKDLAQTGQVNRISDQQSAHMAANTIYNHVLVDKAMGAFDALNLSPTEIEKHKADAIGLLQANSRISVPELAQKLGAMIGKTPGVANRAREKAERFKETTGRRPETITPKPIRRESERLDIAHMSPFDYLEKKTGYQFN